MHVQHHYAHIRSCMAENRIEGDVLGIAWDGTGFGMDGTIWGGEFFRVDESAFKRVATFKQFRLPGGEQAIREPRRTAIGILYEIFGDDFSSDEELPTIRSCSESELNVFYTMLKQKVNSPLTSSAGRLFDAAASLAGIRQIVTHEGQAAMELEFLTEQDSTDDEYPYTIKEDDILHIIDWTQLFKEIIRDIKNNSTQAMISRKFHNTLASIIKDVAVIVGKKKIVLSGGCFQNKYLTERAISILEKAGFQPYWHQRVPPNDGGIALGQIAAVRRKLQNA
jgi:hydrogenase maturation protein HypF